MVIDQTRKIITSPKSTQKYANRVYSQTQLHSPKDKETEQTIHDQNYTNTGTPKRNI
jgi:hypothetical protein